MVIKQMWALTKTEPVRPMNTMVMVTVCALWTEALKIWLSLMQPEEELMGGGETRANAIGNENNKFKNKRIGR